MIQAHIRVVAHIDLVTTWIANGTRAVARAGCL
jgi:hypothetical protein